MFLATIYPRSSKSSSPGFRFHDDLVIFFRLCNQFLSRLKLFDKLEKETNNFNIGISLCSKHLRIKTVPLSLSLHDEKKKTAFLYSKWGLKNFKPWYLSNLNSGKNDDFVFLMLNLLKKTDNCLKNKRYWYFRGDCNVYKMWMKVDFFLEC